MRSTLLFIMSLALSGCYTVLRQSGEFYSEFATDSALEESQSEGSIDDLGPADSDEAYTVYNTYYTPPYGLYDPWGYAYRPYYYGAYASLIIDPWYYDYYYWGGCYYPGLYPHYVPYYPYLGSDGTRGQQRPFGLRNRSLSSYSDNRQVTRTSLWNGQAAVTSRRYRGGQMTGVKNGQVAKPASAVRTTPRAKSARTFNASRPATVRNGGAKSARPSGNSKAGQSKSVTSGQRTFRNKSK